MSWVLIPLRLLLMDRATEAATRSWFSWVEVMRDSLEMAICFQAATLNGTRPVMRRTARRV
jgi:hypothetical protein